MMDINKIGELVYSIKESKRRLNILQEDLGCVNEDEATDVVLIWEYLIGNDGIEDLLLQEMYSATGLFYEDMEPKKANFGTHGELFVDRNKILAQQHDFSFKLDERRECYDQYDDTYEDNVYLQVFGQVKLYGESKEKESEILTKGIKDLLGEIKNLEEVLKLLVGGC